MAIKINFAKSFEELEEIVADFEKGDIDLDEGLKKFERGLVLAHDLKKYLAEVENKVEVLKEKFGQESAAQDEENDLS